MARGGFTNNDKVRSSIKSPKKAKIDKNQRYCHELESVNSSSVNLVEKKKACDAGLTLAAPQPKEHSDSSFKISSDDQPSYRNQ